MAIGHDMRVIERPRPFSPIESVPRVGPAGRGSVVRDMQAPLVADPLARAAAERAWPAIMPLVTQQEARGWGARAEVGERVGVGRVGAPVRGASVAPDRALEAVAPTDVSRPAAMAESPRLARPDRRIHAQWGQGIAVVTEPRPGPARHAAATIEEASAKLPTGSPLLPGALQWPALAPRLAAAQDAGLMAGLPIR